MEITFKNPWSYKTEVRPAYHIALLHIICTLALFGVTMLFVPDTSARTHEYCDSQFENLFLKEIPTSVQKVCKNRFIYNTNKIKRSFPLNSNF